MDISFLVTPYTAFNILFLMGPANWCWSLLVQWLAWRSWPDGGFTALNELYRCLILNATPSTLEGSLQITATSSTLRIFALCTETDFVQNCKHNRDWNSVHDYSNGGPSFIVDPDEDTSSIDILAEYGKDGSPSAVKCKVHFWPSNFILVPYIPHIHQRWHTFAQ